MILENESQKIFKNLPLELQDVIFSEDVANKMMAIGKKYGLPIDKIGELNDETMNITTGLNHPRDFVSKLSKRLDVSTDVAKSIAQEINEQIFAPIRESLKNIHGIKEEVAAAKSPFEQKLEEKVFKPTERPLVKEVEEAKKENRYPSSEDPYREPSK